MKFKTISLILTLSILILLPNALAQEYNHHGYGGMMYGSYGTGFMVFGWIITILIIVLIAVLIYWLIKSANKK